MRPAKPVRGFPGRTARLFAVMLILAATAACGDTEGVPQSATGDGVTPAPEGTVPSRVYERNFVFASLEGDSVFLVPWMMKTVEEPDTVLREARGWLERGGVWDGFFDEQWSGRVTRSPARIVPHGALQLLVRSGDAIDGILFEQGARSLEIILGDAEAAWTGARGGSFEVLDGSAYLGDQRVDGMVLDMSRASADPRPPGGDWAFLLSGDSAQFVLAADIEHGGEVDPLYHGWGRYEDGSFDWPEVRVDWYRTEAFPPARRDIPVEWRIWTSDGRVEGEIEALSADIRPGEGPGPLLPVRALYEVSGSLTTEGGDYPVRGVLVHERR